MSMSVPPGNSMSWQGDLSCQPPASVADPRRRSRYTRDVSAMRETIAPASGAIMEIRNSYNTALLNEANGR